jgi:hypothetical protein
MFVFAAVTLILILELIVDARRSRCRLNKIVYFGKMMLLAFTIRTKVFHFNRFHPSFFHFEVIKAT